ncbi:MAG TPA: ferredoxin [Candidatus Norongarragalinales archaeon]|jgi:ferredoxin|nr:ferredoxin [Candidatus Norongarragalinales archaeon]
MTKYRVVYERDKCIGAFACTNVSPFFWKENTTDNKADLVNGNETSPGVFELEIDEKQLLLMETSANSCPVNIIHVFNKETGEQLV